ncbi:MAG: hypothetical protein GX089_16530 [Fibrobacter sp.]|nr:hypothetical protein [Fibrobacter sp.]
MIKNPNDIVDRLISDYLKITGDGLISAVLFGSAVSHEYHPGKSEISTIFIFNGIPVEKIEACAGVYRKWQRRGVEVTYFMNRDGIGMLLDASPVQFLDIQSNYRILFGEDLLGEVKVEKELLGIQCSRELKNLFLHLNADYLAVSGKSDKTEKLLRNSVLQLIPVFKALLVINDRKIPNTSSEAIASVEDLYGLGASVFSDILYNLKNFSKNHCELLQRFTNTLNLLIRQNENIKGTGTVPV